MNINPISFGKTVRVVCSDRQAALIEMYANREIKPRTEQEANLALDVRMIFNDVSRFDKNKKAEVFYIKDDIYIISGKEAPKARRLNSKFYQTENPFYISRLNEFVKKTQEPYSIVVSGYNVDNFSIQKIDTIA